MPPKLSIVVPVYNEAECIGTVLETAAEVLAARGLTSDCELVVVNDGSRDGTGAMIDAMQQKYPFVRPQHHAVNGGFGAAVWTGITASRGEYVSLMPGDGEIGIEQILRFLDEIGDADLLVSRRVSNDAATREAVRPWHRELLSWGNARLMRTILGFDSRGMEGIFLARGKQLRALSCRSRSGLLCLEIILRLHRQGAKTVCSTMEYRPRLAGQSKVTNLRSVAKTFWDMFKLRRSLAA